MAGGDFVSENSEKDFQPTRQPSGFFIFGANSFEGPKSDGKSRGRNLTERPER
jgi:hypothetical protein